MNVAELAKLKVPELKKLCIEKHLPTKGLKKDLIDRLVNSVTVINNTVINNDTIIIKDNKIINNDTIITDNVIITDNKPPIIIPQSKTSRHLVVCNNFLSHLTDTFHAHYFSEYDYLINPSILQITDAIMNPPQLILLTHTDDVKLSTAMTLAQLIGVPVTVYDCGLGNKPAIKPCHLLEVITIRV
jgi:hypothetical protein